MLYYYEGKPETANLAQGESNMKQAEFGSTKGVYDAIRGILQERNKEVCLKVNDLKKKWKENGFSKDDEENTAKYQAERKKVMNDSTLKRPVVIIKATPNASYANVVSVLDEMQINNINRYQIDRINEVDSAIMAKEVDLSSREWCDLVFEGKNKDFGAYVIRTESPKRHNMAVLWTLIGAVAVAALAFGLVKANQYLEERRLANAQDQTEVLIDMSQEAEEPEPEQQRVEPEKPEVLPEEVLKSVKVTELQIVEDEKVKKEDEIKTQDELKETETAFGQKDNEKGTEDRNITKTLKDEVVVEKKEEKPKEVKEEVFRSVEQMPQFPGGEAALMKYLQSHINYPPMAAENNVQGRVVVQFVVDKTGKVGEVKVVRSVDKDLDKEAVRVCKSLPKFTPGRQNGQAVSVWYTLPVTFKLQGTN